MHHKTKSKNTPQIQHTTYFTILRLEKFRENLTRTDNENISSTNNNLNKIQ